MKICGEWTSYLDGGEEKAKEILKKHLHEFIDELCEKDEFWINVKRDESGKDLLRQENTIGWKIAIPHLKEDN